MGVSNARGFTEGESDIGESYQNASQRTKGAIIGGAVGTVAGAFSTSIGIIPGITVGALFGAAYGSYIDTNTTLEDRLQNRGVNVVVLGDQVLIILPSSHIFKEMSSTIKPQAYSTLELVAMYMNQYLKTLIQVSGYTDRTGTEGVNLALSKEQAYRVAKFLLESGVDARVLYSEGYGSSRLVSRTSDTWDGNDNYRVEITFEKLYV